MNLFWKFRASLLSGLLLANAVVPTTAHSQSVAVNEAHDKKHKDNENDQASSFPSVKTIVAGIATAAATAWAVNFFMKRPAKIKATVAANNVDQSLAPSSSDQQSPSDQSEAPSTTSSTLHQSPGQPSESPRDESAEESVGAAEITLLAAIAARGAQQTLLHTAVVEPEAEHFATSFFVDAEVDDDEEMPPLEEYTPALPPLPQTPFSPAAGTLTARQDAAEALQAEFTPLQFPDATPVDSLRRAHEEAQLHELIQTALRQEAEAEDVDGDIEFYADALDIADRERVVKTPGTLVEFQVPAEDDGDDQDAGQQHGPELIVVVEEELDRELFGRILEASKTPKGRTPRAPVQQDEVQEVQEPEERNNAPVDVAQQDALPQAAVEEQVPQTLERTKQRARRPAATAKKTAAKLALEEAERITATINTRTRIRVQRANEGTEASTVGRARRGPSAKTKDFGDVSKTLPFDEADLK